MTDAKKPASPRTIIDVSHPGKTAPSGTSKPVIVTNRPILKDPMMVSDEATSAAATGVPEKEVPALDKPSTKPDLHPSAEAVTASDAVKSAHQAEEPKLADDQVSQDENASPAAQTAEQEEVEADKQAKHDAEIQKLVEAKQYFLPINSVEQRRTKRFVVLGILLSLLLGLAWVDIALDASLIQVGSVKPITHFFSN